MEIELKDIYIEYSKNEEFELIKEVLEEFDQDTTQLCDIFTGKHKVIRYVDSTKWVVCELDSFISKKTKISISKLIEILSFKKGFRGQLAGFENEFVEKMLDYQEKQLGERDILVFENCVEAPARTNNKELFSEGGFDWANTEEGYDFWYRIIKIQKGKRCREKDLFYFYQKAVSEITELKKEIKKLNKYE